LSLTLSETAHIIAVALPVGVYSSPIKRYTTKPPPLYLTLTAILAAAFTTIRREPPLRTKKQRKTYTKP